MNDLVDVILENDKYKEKLLLTNVKNGEYYVKVIAEMNTRCESRGETYSYDVKQTRQKFKRCATICRGALLKVKNASGIKRFQEDKELGQWFNKLMPVVGSMDSCQPEQAIEPGSLFQTEDVSDDEIATSSKSLKRKNMFTPVHETARK